MDFGSLIGRAWSMTWRNKFMWVLGFLVALGSGGVSFSSNFSFPMPNTSSATPSLPGPLNELLEPGGADRLSEAIAPLMGALAVLACVGVLVSIVLWVVSIIARAGLIAGADQIERDGNSSFRGAWSAGAPKFWRLLGLAILVVLPVLLVLIVGGCLSVFGITTVAAAAGSSSSSDANGAIGGIILAMMCVGAMVLCVMMIYGLIAGGIVVYAERAIVIANAGLIDSVGAGWAMLRRNLGNTILIALLIFIISIVVGIAVGIVAAVFALPSAVIMFGAAGSDSGIFSTAGIAIALFTGLIISIIGALIAAVFTAFYSNVWTLAYNEFVKATPDAQLAAGSVR